MRSLWRRRLLGILLAVILMMFVPLSIAFAGLRPFIVRAFVDHTSLPGRLEGATLTFFTFNMGVLFNFLLFSTLYFFGPSKRRRLRRPGWGRWWPAILWEATRLFTSLHQMFSSYQMLYGSSAH